MPRSALTALFFILAAIVAPATGKSEPASPKASLVFDAVTEIRAEVPVDARTAQALGTERQGSGVVIDDSGLIATIGYLILEASAVTVTDIDGHELPADIVAYDHDTGLGLVRALGPMGRPSLSLGDSADLARGEPVLVVSSPGAEGALPAAVVDVRTFTGYWEYMLEGALFVHPPHPAWQGAAMVGADGRLLGIGSLFSNDAQRRPVRRPGNMFVPVDALKAVLADMLTEGRGAASRRPWLGIFSSDLGGYVAVTFVSPDGPAAAAGIRRGDVILKVGEKGIRTMTDFYRAVWALGDPGVAVPLTIGREDHVERVSITSGDRYRYLKLEKTY